MVPNHRKEAFMKKFLLMLTLLFACSAAVFAFPSAARAEGETETYARVTRDGVYFYSTPASGAGLFVLPRTYFVKIVDTAGEYYRVRYLDSSGDGRALEGYCLADEIEPVGYTPETPYLVYSVTVTYRAGGDYSLPDSSLSEYTVTADYYGEFDYGSSTCYYVRLNGQFGYVPADSCSVVDYPENTEHTVQETPSSDDGSAENENSFGALNVVLICVLAVAALGAIYFLFRPAKGKKEGSPSFYDETEDVF